MGAEIASYKGRLSTRNCLGYQPVNEREAESDGPMGAAIKLPDGLDPSEAKFGWLEKSGPATHSAPRWACPT